MFKNLKFKIKNLPEGITLVEIIVVIFIIALFSAILVADFPKIKLQFALSRATYKFMQNLRKAQDMGFSGIEYRDGEGNIIPMKGYGIYFNLFENSKQYIIYGDVYADEQYSASSSPQDQIIETFSLEDQEAGIFIKEIKDNNGSGSPMAVSINFQPPNPKINIVGTLPGQSSMDIIFAIESDNSKTRTVSINSSGLIETK